MPESTPVIAFIMNYLLVGLFAGAAVWVFFDTRKRGRPLSESIAWALFMGAMLPLAVVVYIIFRRAKFL